MPTCVGMTGNDGRYVIHFTGWYKNVIPGLVPGTRVSNSAAIGPRDKPGDDVEGWTVAHVEPNAFTLAMTV